MAALATAAAPPAAPPVPPALRELSYDDAGHRRGGHGGGGAADGDGDGVGAAADGTTDAPPFPDGRVLSIQSSVCHGYVGNKSAVFPLQLLGFDVDPINSVQFSNHTGYEGGFEGQVLGGQELEALVDGLDANGLMPEYSHLLTGYIGSPSFLRAVLRVLARLRARRPGLRYVCDPVMGDRALGPYHYLLAQETRKL